MKGLTPVRLRWRSEHQIEADATAGDLHDRLSRLGADLMVRALDALAQTSLTLSPQAQTGVTYANKIEKRETVIDWARPWQDVHNHIRGLSPSPGAWFEWRGGGDTGPSLASRYCARPKAKAQARPAP